MTQLETVAIQRGHKGIVAPGSGWWWPNPQAVPTPGWLILRGEGAWVASSTEPQGWFVTVDEQEALELTGTPPVLGEGTPSSEERTPRSGARTRPAAPAVKVYVPLDAGAGSALPQTGTDSQAPSPVRYQLFFQGAVSPAANTVATANTVEYNGVAAKAVLAEASATSAGDGCACRAAIYHFIVPPETVGPGGAVGPLVVPPASPLGRRGQQVTPHGYPANFKVYFDHGLGDCVYFAHQLLMYRQRGFEIGVACAANKQLLFQASAQEVSYERGTAPHVPWWESQHPDAATAGQFWHYNKAAINLSQPPLPDIGVAQDLWHELYAIQLDVTPYIEAAVWQAVRQFLKPLPRPHILIHSRGNTGTEWKSIPDDIISQVYGQLLEETEGSLILLDWDNRVPRCPSWRVRHLLEGDIGTDLPHLMAFLHEADLLLGIDSGPLHAARCTAIPTVGVFPRAEHYPTRWCLPRACQVNIVPSEGTRQLNRETRIAYNIIESPGDTVEAATVTQACRRMLAPPRYLDQAHLGADAQLQQFVLEWERARGGALSDYVDRHTSYDLLLREARARFIRPLFVETGCIRAAEDWQGAGYSTYLLGAYVQRCAGRLISVDNDPEHCAFAWSATRELPQVQVICEDSLSFLQAFDQTIDVLLIDSVDTEHPHAAAHALAETQAAMRLLQPRSLIIFDDTVYSRRQFTGKGALAVPWLVEQGWQILYAGYQVICAQ